MQEAGRLQQRHMSRETLVEQARRARDWHKLRFSDLVNELSSLVVPDENAASSDGADRDVPVRSAASASRVLPLPFEGGHETLFLLVAEYAQVLGLIFCFLQSVLVMQEPPESVLFLSADKRRSSRLLPQLSAHHARMGMPHLLLLGRVLGQAVRAPQCPWDPASKSMR